MPDPVQAGLIAEANGPTEIASLIVARTAGISRNAISVTAPEAQDASLA